MIGNPLASPQFPNLHGAAAVSQRNQLAVARDRDRTDSGEIRGEAFDFLF
jgi:hypothetical protein